MAKKGQTVTRYSHNPLAKKFKCPQCGNWFRTLQGLSGHIRFKHETSEKKDDIIGKFAEVEERKNNLVAKGRGLGLSTSDIKAREQILNQWADLVEYCWTFGVRLNPEDLKNYVIRSFELRSG